MTICELVITNVNRAKLILKLHEVPRCREAIKVKELSYMVDEVIHVLKPLAKTQLHVRLLDLQSPRMRVQVARVEPDFSVDTAET